MGSEASGDAKAALSPRWTGRASVADKHGHFVDPLQKGAIVVVDQPDLNFEMGQALASASPAVVLNAAPSKTGRQPATGTKTLLRAGVPVVDRLGSAVLELSEGEDVIVEGGTVLVGDAVVSEGRLVVSSDLEGEEDQMRLSARIESYALSAKDDFESESALIIEGELLPNLESLLDGKVVAVVGPMTSESELKQRLKVLANYHPVVIAVGSGALQAAAAKAKVDIVVGDPRDVPASILRKARAVVAVGREDKEARQLLKQHAIASHQVPTSLSDLDIALLTAYHSGAELIVDASEPRDVEQFFDSGAAQAVGSMLTRIQVADKLVSLEALAEMYRAPVPTWALVGLFVAALVAGASAFAFTPQGFSLLQMLINGGSLG